MRLLDCAPIVALVSCLGGCGNRHGAGPDYSVDKCPPLPASTPPFGSAKLGVIDALDNLAPPGSPLNLRPERRTDDPKDPGVCVDAASGDIHLYGSKTKSVTFLLSFNPALAISAIWPVNANDAILTSDNPNGPWGRPTFNQAFVEPRKLMFTVAYERGRKPYYYRLQYADPNDPEDAPHPIQAMIVNH